MIYVGGFDPFGRGRKAPRSAPHPTLERSEADWQAILDTDLMGNGEVLVVDGGFLASGVSQ